MNILRKILAQKRQEAASAKKETSLAQLKMMPCYERQCFSLNKALMNKDIAVIAEIKKASPSKGIICKNFDPIEIAKKYVAGGAAAISILTDKKYFQGDIKFIANVRSSVPIPILRKDFIIDSYQLYEAKAFGADAVLLITAALEPIQLNELHDEACNLGLECLVEVHNEQELETLDFSKIKLLGVNNRNLSDFSVDISTAIRLAKKIPSGITIISESGISTNADIKQLVENGIHAVLVGESLMRSSNPQEALKALVSQT